MKDYDVLKLIFIFVVFFEAFLMGLLPVKVKQCKDSPSVLGVANAFSGGVFISIALMHIMPEQTESYSDHMCKQYQKKHPGEDCPDAFTLPYLLLVSGYTIILVLDKVLFDAHSMLHDDDHHDVD